MRSEEKARKESVKLDLNFKKICIPLFKVTGKEQFSSQLEQFKMKLFVFATIFLCTISFIEAFFFRPPNFLPPSPGRNSARSCESWRRECNDYCNGRNCSEYCEIQYRSGPMKGTKIGYDVFISSLANIFCVHFLSKMAQT